MKALRFIGISLLVTFFVIVLSSCGGDSDEPNVDPTPIPAAARIDFPAEQNTSPVISSEGGAVNITFTSSQAWTASIVNDRADEWISLSATNGIAGTSVLSITTKPNDTYDERSATITIKSGTVSKNIIVTQKQKDALLVSSEKIEMDVEGGEVQVEVKANVDFSVETDVDWISHISTRSLKTSNLVFTVTENEGTQKREGHITIKSGMLLETVTVYQAANTPTIIISQNEYAIGSDGGDIKVEVSSNVDVSVTLPKGGWISESTTRSMSTHTYVFTVTKNEGYDSRSGEILFTNNENNLSEKVVITQMQRDAIIVARSKYEMDAEGGTLSFEVQTNVDFEVSVDADWLTRADTRALRTEKLKFNVESNDTYDERNATITIKSAEITQKISVVQHGLAAVTGIELSYSSLELNVGDSYQLTATVFPTDASNKEVEWSSSDESIAIVDDEGNVTAVAEGKAYITVTTIDGNWSDTCTVIVTDEDDEDDDSGIATLSDPLTLEAIESGTITIKNPNRLLISYVKNKGAKETSSRDVITIPIIAGDKVCFYGDNSNYYASHIQLSSGCYIYGNIMSLIDSKNFAQARKLAEKRTFSYFFEDNKNLRSHDTKKLILPATTLAEGCYYRMFYDCKNLTTAPSVLPATTLAEGCYEGMFEGCESLTTAPELPATTLAKRCYCDMFRFCTSLYKAPDLPATTLAQECYSGMFDETNVLPDTSNIDFTSKSVLQSGGLRGLFLGTKVTDENLARILPKNEKGKYYLPATTLAEGCYEGMFEGCTNLTTAPELPATTLADGCYGYMFSWCTSLTTAPELPATTLAEGCYYWMFAGCDNLTKVPALPVTTLADGCYGGMFGGCTSLTKAPDLPATTLVNDCYRGMFSGCTSLTTSPELPATTLADGCYGGMFGGCTSLTKAPDLPATTLADRCYAEMFAGCTSLTKAPELPATTLASNCYFGMFRGCTNLNYIKAMFTTEPYNEPEIFTGMTSFWLSGVSPTGTFIKNSAATWDITGPHGIPEGWKVEYASK